jgi:hypothetical protein
MAHEDDPHLPDPSVPVALYEGPKLALFRGWRLVGLVIACVALGALGREAILHLPKEQTALPPEPPRPTLLSAAGPVVHAELQTPQGMTMSLPSSQPVLVNVWLQNCADCRPAFAAWRALVDEHKLPEHMTVYNVAYGTADEGYAKEWRVNEKLLFDPGPGLVQPLGISSFTTLVLDRHGRVRLRDRPDAPGYAERVTGALQALWSDPDARAPEPEGGCGTQ